MEGAEIAIICGSIGGVFVFLVVFVSIARHICRKARKVEVIDEEFAEDTLLSNDANKIPAISTITTGSNFYNYNETNNEVEIFPEFSVEVHSTIYDLDLADTTIISPASLNRKPNFGTSIRGIENASYGFDSSESDTPYLEVRNGVYVICKNGTLFDPESAPWSAPPQFRIKPETPKKPETENIIKSNPTYAQICTRPKDKPKVLLPQKLKPENNNTITTIPPSLHPISEEFCVLVIAVDATPEGVGGYCVNLIEKSCETYYLKTHQMPWSLQRHNDSSEFEMKNLMFALMLWQPEIIKNRLFKIYTDNTAVNSSTNKFGFVAAKLLKHCDNCIGFNVRRVNKNPYCNSGRNWNEFMKYIQPADHLSRGQQDLSEKLIHSYYGIPYSDFKRSHKPSDRNQINSEFMEKVNATVDRWKKRCDGCGYSYRLGALKYVGPRGGKTHKTKNYTSQNRYR